MQVRRLEPINKTPSIFGDVMNMEMLFQVFPEPETIVSSSSFCLVGDGGQVPYFVTALICNRRSQALRSFTISNELSPSNDLQSPILLRSNLFLVIDAK